MRKIKALTIALPQNARHGGVSTQPHSKSNADKILSYIEDIIPPESTHHKVIFAALSAAVSNSPTLKAKGAVFLLPFG